jgi:hypothetical protein
MSPVPTTTETHVDIDGHDFLLSPGQDIDDLMRRIEDAARSDGTFVRFASSGAVLDALISRSSRVVIAVGAGPSHRGSADLSEYARSDWDY